MLICKTSNLKEGVLSFSDGSNTASNTEFLIEIQTNSVNQTVSNILRKSVESKDYKSERIWI